MESKPMWKSKTTIANLIFLGLWYYGKKSGVDIISTEHAAGIIATTNILLRKVTGTPVTWK